MGQGILIQHSEADVTGEWTPEPLRPESRATGDHDVGDVTGNIMEATTTKLGPVFGFSQDLDLDRAFICCLAFSLERIR